MSVFETQEPNTDNQPDSSGTPAADASAQGTNEPVVDTGNLFADQLAAITAPDGRQKYSDVPTALQSIPHAQAKIQELSDELTKLKEENARMKGFEAVLERLDGGNNGSADTPSTESINPEQLSSIIDSQLQRRETLALQAQNEQAVSAALASKFGDTAKAVEQLQKKANELGVDMNTMRTLAQTSPKAVLSYFEQAAPAQGQPMGFGTAAFVDTNNGEPDPRQEAKAALFGKQDPLMEKWKKAAN